jgi:class 3 adenylate cyclase/tetratricopeptide (TPR) repeat protein
VTVLFADIVGFTSLSETLDPEDVRALLAPYHARLRTELERFGGTVEKFIGDAVMALFGAPVAHEDDPERAVRAALAIRDWVRVLEGGLPLRIGVNTGEALVVLDARPAEGEGMASGDVVNTAARLQTASPVNGVLVGDTTYRATSHAIIYRPAAPVVAKGKAEPVAAWEAVEARARLGVDLARPGGAPLVGRVRELRLLSESLARVRRDRSPRRVTIVGAPGMGKSRLVAELFRRVDDDPTELVIWRQGRCLPYGDGVTLWAVAEMVKGQAGILETDRREAAAQKLHSAVANVVIDRADAHWVEGHLRPLVGLGGTAALGGGTQSEAFAAWRLFFEMLAERNPLVLVFEDLQWADDSLLDFIDHLIDGAIGVPMLAVCTTRPELLDRHPGWGDGERSEALSLRALSGEETATLISSLTDRPVLLAETQQALLARAGGNPLYAEQYVRMLAERREAKDLPVPETIQAIIAARLDALTIEEKTLLQDAAVVGKVFWVGAVNAIGGVDRRCAERTLQALERKEFVARARRSSVADDAEFTFLHVLVRDVGYGQISRAERVEKHRLAAEWIESLGRTEDHAEMLAHHYLSAIGLLRATGRPVDAVLAERALERLRDAGSRAFSLNAYANAARFYEAALELEAVASPERAQLVFQLARSRFLAGDVEANRLLEASTELLAHGDPETAAEAELLLADLTRNLGARDRSSQHVERARYLVEGREPSRARAHVLSSVSRYLMLAAEDAEAIRVGRGALAMADALRLDDVRAHALNNIGASLAHTDRMTGIQALEQSAAVAVAAHVPAEICRARSNLAVARWELGQLDRALRLWEEAAETASRFGQIWFRRLFRGNRAEKLFVLGRWSEAMATASAFLMEVEAGLPHHTACGNYATRAQIRLGRGDVPGALADAEQSLELARLVKDPQALYPAVSTYAHVLRESGSLERAAVLADEFLAELQAGRRGGFAIVSVLQLSWTLSALGRGRELLSPLSSADTPWARAAVAFAAGDLLSAAEICAAMGALTEEARVRLWLAGVLVEQNRHAEAEVHLRRALAFYRSVAATRYIAEGERLLAVSA